MFDKDNNATNPPTTGQIIKQNTSVKVYPNPANQEVRIAAAEANEISIYNMLGVLVKQEPKLSEPQNVDLSDITEGIYIVGVKLENGTVNKKLQIVK